MNRGIMVQGTASNVGKSALSTALCRIFKQDGYRVAPFKGWNMALNSYVTRDGGEIGRAQGEQAMACGIEATVDMNPVLIKSKGEGEVQVIIRGRPWRDMKIGEDNNLDHEYRRVCLDAITSSLNLLKTTYDILVLEGAGSPAEINLRDMDMANMTVAGLARVPVLLVADIDRGGALASVVGTMMLLNAEEREMVAGIVFNKFRGDIDILEPGLKLVEERTGKPVAGVIPYLRGLNLAAEDGVVLQDAQKEGIHNDSAVIKITVIKLPRISNFTDFDVLRFEPDVHISFIEPGEDIGETDAIILPGSKNSVADLLALNDSGSAGMIIRAAREGIPVIGICGGYQMLGRELQDPLRTESSHGTVAGLGLIDAVTRFYPEKQVCRVKAEVTGLAGLLPDLRSQFLTGYEIHMGQTELFGSTRSALKINQRSGVTVNVNDGAVGEAGFVFGTYLHGIFDNPAFRGSLLTHLRRKKGHLGPVLQNTLSFSDRINQTYNLLAGTVRHNLDMDLIYKIVSGKKNGG